jgi:predicted DNA binding protein
MVRHGGTLEQVTVRSDSESFTATVRLPSDTVVREYADAVTDALGDIELVGKYDDASDQQPNQRAVGTTDARLTDRQRETLQMAFHAGYFDQPRSTDADSVAAELGIAQSTFSQHLRAAERKLLEGLFL